MKNPFYRKPDFVVGPAENPYLHRWHVIARNKIFNIYLHHFLRDDDDRALHDHPGWNVSLLLSGEYIEHVPESEHALEFSQYRPEVMTETKKFLRRRWHLYFRRATDPHRVELTRDTGGREKPVWTLFVNGPKRRVWGFHCPKGWVEWSKFVRHTPGGNQMGDGCG